MKRLFIVALIFVSLVISEILSVNVLDYRFRNQNEMSTFKSHLQGLSLGELKKLIELVNAYETWKKREEVKRNKELEAQRKMQNANELRRQRVLQAYFLANFGGSSVMKDFFSNRI